MDINELEQIIAILKANGVTEFELENGDTHIRLRREEVNGIPSSVSVHTGDVTPAIITSSNGKTGAGPAAHQDDVERFFKVESPIVGTFYRKPSPDADPFVKEGARSYSVRTWLLANEENGYLA